MSDRRLVIVLALALLPAVARAQDTRADLPRLLALRERVRVVDAQRTNERNRDRAVSAAQRIGALYQSGSLRLISHGSAPVLAGGVRRADSLLTAFGAIPTEFIAGTVLVQVDVANRDALLAAAEPATRVLEVDVARMQVEGDAVWPLVSVVATAYRQELYSDWRDWLPQDLATVWIPEREGVGAMTALTEAIWSHGQSCLAGNLGSCARWLALDDASNPYGTRYVGEDLRRSIRRVNVLSADQDYETCLLGNDPACLRIAQRHPNFVVALVPANELARASVLRAVHDRYGADALARALRDSVGSRGDRLSRATGASLDSVLSHWRLYVLRRGHVDRVTAGWPHVLSAVLTAGLLAALAARSGRWR